MVTLVTPNELLPLAGDYDGWCICQVTRFILVNLPKDILGSEKYTKSSTILCDGMQGPSDVEHRNTTVRTMSCRIKSSTSSFQC